MFGQIREQKVVDAVWTQVWQKSGEHVILKATGMLDSPSQLKCIFAFVLLPCRFWCTHGFVENIFHLQSEDAGLHKATAWTSDADNILVIV